MTPEKFRYTKKHLLIVLDMSRDTFAKRMKVLEPEIKVKFPYYEKHMQIIPSQLFKWICDQIGPERDEIETIIEENFASNRKNLFTNGKLKS